MAITENEDAPSETKASFEQGETPEFSGKSIAYLANDSANLMKKTGRIFPTIDLAHEYQFTEDDGTLPTDFFTVKMILLRQKRTWLAAIFPEWVKMPKTLVHMAGFKF